jgi:hypothetical protein
MDHVDQIIASLLVNSEQKEMIPDEPPNPRNGGFPLIVSRETLNRMCHSKDFQQRLLGWKWPTYFTTGAVIWLLEREGGKLSEGE